MNQQQRSYATEKCAWCGASGKWRFAPGNTMSCVVCDGKGMVSVAQPASKCLQCNGSGKRNSTTPCLKCAGTGWEHVANQG